MSSREIDALMGRSELIEDALARIPGDQSLAAPAGEIPWDALHDLYAAFGGIPGIGLAKATKALHKKRPHLVPMLDSVVAAYLRSVEEIPVGDFADEALGLTRSYKVDLDANCDVLVSVQHGLNEQGYVLSLCRILDLYTWSYAGDSLPSWAAEAGVRFVSRSDEASDLAAKLGIELDESGVTLEILRAAIREVGSDQARNEIKRWLGS